MPRGKFITFEGIDGCGKSTQARMLAQWLTDRGVPVIATREPGGTAPGQAIRAVILNPALPVVPLTELLLYAADRAHHVRSLITPALESGQLVLCDRYADATMAYQGYGRGFDPELVTYLNQLATGGLRPDLTLLFDLDVAEGLRRVGERHEIKSGSPGDTVETGRVADRLDMEPMEFHTRVRQGYLALAAREPERFRLVPAAASMADIHQQVISLIQTVL
ncbi:MAG: dTMP kinase [Blastocatellia bacterium]